MLAKPGLSGRELFPDVFSSYLCYYSLLSLKCWGVSTGGFYLKFSLLTDGK